MWKYGKRIILDYEVDECIEQHHNGLLYRHPGTITIIEIIQRNCYFLRMRSCITNYITKCVQCQCNKHATYAMYGETTVMLLLEALWEEITMDFITKLLKSKDPIILIMYNSIIIVVDRLIKYIYFIPLKEMYDVEQLRYLYIDRII